MIEWPITYLAAEEAVEDDTSEALAGARILVVEDNPVSRVVVRGMLERLGGHVEMACNGRDAVDLASYQRYDLILMDCQMPLMDGFEATRIIRERESAAGRTGNDRRPKPTHPQTPPRSHRRHHRQCREPRAVSGVRDGRLPEEAVRAGALASLPGALVARNLPTGVGGMLLSLPTSTRVLPLARKRELVPELAQALILAEDRGVLPLVSLLGNALALGRELEQAVRQTPARERATKAPDRVLERLLRVSLELGQVLRRAREFL